MNSLKKKNGWELPSNSGRYLARWIVEPLSDTDFLCDFELSANSWELSSDSDHNNVPSVFLQIGRLIVERRALTEFSSSISTWISLPIDQLGKTEFQAEAELGSRSGEYVRIKFAPNPNIIDDHHPLANFTANVGGVSSTFSYTADQTCLRIMLEGIRMTLSIGSPLNGINR